MEIEAASGQIRLALEEAGTILVLRRRVMQLENQLAEARAEVTDLRDRWMAAEERIVGLKAALDAAEAR